MPGLGQGRDVIVISQSRFNDSKWELLNPVLACQVWARVISGLKKPNEPKKPNKL
jgi:hypothetical protein